jgi:hypothetical protein
MTRKCLFLSLLFLAEVLLVHFFVLQRFPNSGDEQAYLFQARLYARNQLYVEDPIYDRANPLERFVRADALDDMAGRRFPKYDPGWPLLLSVGSRLGAEWLIAPLLGATTVFLLLCYIRKRIGEQFVWPAWSLVVLCSFFVCSVANFGNHTAAMSCLFAAFFLYDGIAREPDSPGRSWQFLCVGLLLAYCSLIRYLDWIPLMAWIAFELVRRRRIKALGCVLLGFALLVWVHLLYNKIMTGDALQPPAVHHALGTQDASLTLSWGSFENTAIRLFRVLFTFPPVLLLLLSLKRPFFSTNLRTFVLLFALNVSIYLLYALGPAGPGPRYYLPYFPFLFLAVIEVYRLHRTERIATIGWRVSLVCLLLCSGLYAGIQAVTVYRRLDLERNVGRLPEKKKVILLQTGTYKMGITDLIRNPLDLWTADTVYLDYGDGEGLEKLLARFPEHRVYSYRYPGSLTPWEVGKRP